MRFNINLATRTYINTKLLKILTAAAVLLLATLLFFNVRNGAVIAAEIKRVTSEIARSDDKSKTTEKAVSEKEYRALMDRIAFANSVIERKTYNWLALLDSLEQVVPDGVAISSIEPETKSQALRLSGIAKNFNNLRTFVEHLEDSKFFSDVYLASQAEAKLGDPNLSTAQWITFNLTCRVVKK
jgi:type IV pilus assembly protein PilN